MSRGTWPRRETGIASRELPGVSFSTTPASARTAEADDHLRAEGARNSLQEIQPRPGSRALQPRDARLLRLHALGELLLRETRLLAQGFQLLCEAILVEPLIQPGSERGIFRAFLFEPLVEGTADVLVAMPCRHVFLRHFFLLCFACDSSSSTCFIRFRATSRSALSPCGPPSCTRAGPPSSAQRPSRT